MRIVESAEVDKSLLLALSAAEVMQDEPRPHQTRFTQTGRISVVQVTKDKCVCDLWLHLIFKQH